MIREITINSGSDIEWSVVPSKEQYIIIRTNNKDSVQIPVCVITGNLPGPTFTVMSGMHAGEYSGIFAAHELISNITPDQLSGRLIIIPIISTRAFFERSMQISPVDEKEIHFLIPGKPNGTYSDLLIDTLFEIVKESDYLIDLHSGEMIQSLIPWVPIPMLGNVDMQKKAVSLAKGYRVDYLEYRYELNSIPPLCLEFANAGIVNIWVEIGKNGIPDPSDISTHYDGLISALKTVGSLKGKPDRPKHKILKGRRYQINASESGVWHSYVKEGQIVQKGELLGKLTDIFGNLIQEYRASKRSFVFYYWTSPAINIDRKPHGYDWHTGLVSLLELEDDSL